MAGQLRVLIVEDSALDAELIQAELGSNGYALTCCRVETVEAMEATLDQQDWDAVISDYRMPRFSALAALELLHRKGLDLPFILVSGAIGEEDAVAAMRAGAHDFLIKGFLKRLVPALERELREAENRRQRRRAERAIHENEARLGAIMDNAPLIVFAKDLQGRHLFVNRGFEQLFGMAREEIKGKTDVELFPRGMVEEFAVTDRKVIETGQLLQWETYIPSGEGRQTYISIKFPLRDASGTIYAICGMATDITERKRAEEKFQQAHERLQLLSNQLFKAQELERRHIARELHDEIGQALTATKINLQALAAFPDPDSLQKRLDDSVQLVDRILQQVRTLCMGLRPPLLDDLGLVPALQVYVEQQGARAGLRTQFFAPTELPRLGAGVETACFRVAQESVTNVLRHARAKSLAVELRLEESSLHLLVRDDGVGFDPEALHRNGVASLGRTGMMDRVALTGGKVTVNSSAGKGTTVHAFFPLENDP